MPAWWKGKVVTLTWVSVAGMSPHCCLDLSSGVVIAPTLSLELNFLQHIKVSRAVVQISLVLHERHYVTVEAMDTHAYFVVGGVQSATT